VHDYTSPKFKNLKDAENEEARYRIKISSQEVCTNNITIEQAYQELRYEKSKSNKIQTTRKDDILYRYLVSLKNIKINDLNLKVYRAFRSNLESAKLTVAYKNKILRLFVQIIKFSSKYYNTNDQIIKFVENFKDVNHIKKEMEFFTYNEYKAFDKVIDKFEYHVFFEVLYFLGLRQGETQALTWKDVDLNNNTIKITKTLTTKIKGEKWTISSPKTKNSIRTLPLPKQLLNDLKTLKNTVQKYKDFSESWFVFGNTEPFRESTIQKKKNEYCKLAGLKQIRVHDFRHSCASLLINKGGSIQLVSKYLGHANISITLNIYTHLYQSELSNMTDILNNL